MYGLTKPVLSTSNSHKVYNVFQKLRQRREQYRRYRQRLQIQQLQRRQRTRASTRPSRSIPTSPTDEPVEQEAVTPPPLQRNEPPPASTKRPPLSQLFPLSPHPPPPPPSTLPIPLLETSTNAQQLPSPTRSEVTRETCSEAERDPNIETHTALGGDSNVRSESSETSNGVGGKRVHFSECSTGGEGAKNNQSTAVPHVER
ncbi:hypothetical protein GBAR_LOCUS20848 [Geodia barretti]|uniref:Uncharacterized protein n=1 Tax=Geodia barretti TaxID=519541 RepID=A0AA35SXK2_GEOBA|nr:hypothetical protein GBAR_LOCUS20848 [Geodia barretti]